MAWPISDSGEDAAAGAPFASFLVADCAMLPRAGGSIGNKNRRGIRHIAGHPATRRRARARAWPAPAGVATSCRQLAFRGSSEDSTSCCRARVMATYSAFSSSRARAVLSACSAATALGGGRVSLARNMKLRGAAASPGQSTSTPMVCAAALGRVGVQQQHQRRFQPLGAVHGQQAHGLASAAGGRLQAAGLERAHQRIRRGVAGAVHLSSARRQQGAQVRQHAAAQRRGRGGAKARQHVAIGDRSRSSASCGGRVSSQPFHCIKTVASPCPSGAAALFFVAARTSAARRRCPLSARVCRCSGRSAPASSSLRPNSGDFSARASDRSCAGDTSTSSSATMSSTSGASTRSVFSGCCAGNVQRAQFVLHQPQPVAFARQHHDVLRLQAARQLLRDPGAAWRHSSVRRVSSGSLARRASGCRATPARRHLAPLTHPGPARGICGSRAPRPPRLDSVVCAAKTLVFASVLRGRPSPGSPRRAPAVRCAACGRSSAGRRPGPRAQTACAARNTCGSARRKR